MIEERHQKILSMLSERRQIRGREIVETFGVTPMTAWRDMRALVELGLARRIRGGLKAVGRMPGELPYESRHALESAVKRAIAQEAAERYIREGMVVALGGGTTMEAVVPFLPEQRLSILTNSLPVAMKIREERPRLPVRLIGGWMSPVSGNLTGTEAIREAGRLKANLCLLSAGGFDAEVGPSDPDPLEIRLKRKLADISRRTVLLLDGSKFGQRYAGVSLHPRRLDALITDRAPPEEIARLCSRREIRIELAPT